MSNVILVNNQDEAIGERDKMDAHLGEGELHRAYTILVSNNRGEVLLQKRAKGKMLWPLFWEATCSSHQTQGGKSENEQIKLAEKRLGEEMGFTCNLKLISKFQYHNLYKNIGAEKELCWLLIGEWGGTVSPNPEEVVDYQWVMPISLIEEIKQKPSDFAPWLFRALEIFIEKQKNENKS